MQKVPNSIPYVFEPASIRKKRYKQDLLYLKEHSEVEYVFITGENGVQIQKTAQFKPVLRELVDYAHSIGLKVGLRPPVHPGFFDDYRLMPSDHPADEQVAITPISDPQKADAITNDVELVCDADGYAEGVSVPLWGRHRFPPIYAEVLRAYVFDKTDGEKGEGFYRPGSLEDVTDRVTVTSSKTGSIGFELELGSAYAGKTVFVLTAHFYNHYEIGEGHWQAIRKFMDDYADVPLDAVTMDEYGYMLLSLQIKNGKVPPFRGRRYSHYMDSYYRRTLGEDLKRLLFDMRYAPQGLEQVRIRAINTYFEKLRIFPLEVEQKVHDYAKMLFGEDTYVCCHDTFHNNLDQDEIWHTACNWWDIPREYGHTDENISFPVRMGVMLACRSPIEIDMFYSKKEQDFFDHMAQGAPFGCREFHHDYNSDGFWGINFTDPAFLRRIRSCDRKIAMLDAWQTQYPKLDLLVIYGAAAQNNWYPDYENRNIWDINGSLGVMEKCDQMWQAGYRCALVPDYAVEDGRITLEDGRVCFNGYAFDHCLMLYPRYAKAQTYAFLNRAYAQGASVAAVGPADLDFEGRSAELTAPHYDGFSMDILNDLGCPTRSIPNGGVYTDGSFCLAYADGLVSGAGTEFDFTLDGVRYSGVCTGILACRMGVSVIGTQGTTLFADGQPVQVSCPVQD